MALSEMVLGANVRSRPAHLAILFLCIKYYLLQLSAEATAKYSPI